MLLSGAVDQDFGLSEEQREVVAAVRAFAGERVAPAAAGLEERGAFPRELFAALGEMGLAGVPYDERYGGAGLDWLTYMAVLEELAKASLPLAVTVSVHHLSAFGIHDFGSEELKERYLPRMLSACEFRTGEPRQIILAGEKGSADTEALLRTLHSRFVPNRIVLLVDSPETRRALATGIASIESMHPIEGRTSAYVCRNYTCLLPFFEAEKLAELLQ